MPKFPLSNHDASGGPQSDIVAQSKDVSFLVHAMLHLRSAVPGLGRVIKPTAIGLSGFSDGGATVLTTMHDPCCGSMHLRAVVATSSDVPNDNAQDAARSTPLLLIRGDANPGYQRTVQTYQHARRPKALVTLHGAPHQVYTDPWRAIVERAEIAFFNRYLRNEDQGLAVLRNVGSCAPFVATDNDLKP